MLNITGYNRNGLVKEMSTVPHVEAEKQSWGTDLQLSFQGPLFISDL